MSPSTCYAVMATIPAAKLFSHGFVLNVVYLRFFTSRILFAFLLFHHYYNCNLLNTPLNVIKNLGFFGNRFCNVSKWLFEVKSLALQVSHLLNWSLTGLSGDSLIICILFYFSGSKQGGFISKSTWVTFEYISIFLINWFLCCPFQFNMNL